MFVVLLLLHLCSALIKINLSMKHTAWKNIRADVRPFNEKYMLDREMPTGNRTLQW